ncbi:MAG: regulatory protein RecX [Salibacteraceae bacterium]
MVKPTKKIGVSEAIIKTRTFCNYRERCHKEVRDKLYGMGLWKVEVEEVMLQMMDENLLNEERFARSFARGYFRNKRWGKFKIKMSLRERQIHSNLIETALTEIDEVEYEQSIKHLIEKKNAMIKNLSKPVRRQKISNYLLQKGYSFGEFSAYINDFLA